MDKEKLKNALKTSLCLLEESNNFYELAFEKHNEALDCLNEIFEELKDENPDEYDYFFAYSEDACKELNILLDFLEEEKKYRRTEHSLSNTFSYIKNALEKLQ